MSVALMGQGGAVFRILIVIIGKMLKQENLCLPSFFSTTLFGISEPAIFWSKLEI